MSSIVEHPLARFLAAPSRPMQGPVGEEPAYDPRSQLQVQWVDIENHRDVLCSGEKTGDPDTRSATTAPPGSTPGYPSTGRSDDDTDDSGT